MVSILMQKCVDASSNTDANSGTDATSITPKGVCLIEQDFVGIAIIAITCMTKPGRVLQSLLLVVIGGAHHAIDLLRGAWVERENQRTSGVVLRLGGPAKPRERAGRCLEGMVDRWGCCTFRLPFSVSLSWLACRWVAMLSPSF